MSAGEGEGVYFAADGVFEGLDGEVSWRLVLWALESEE